MNIALKLALGATAIELLMENQKLKEIVLEKSKAKIKQEKTTEKDKK